MSNSYNSSLIFCLETCVQDYIAFVILSTTCVSHYVFDHILSYLVSHSVNVSHFVKTIPESVLLYDLHVLARGS